MHSIYRILEAKFKLSNTEAGMFKVLWHKGSINVQPLDDTLAYTATDPDQTVEPVMIHV